MTNMQPFEDQLTAVVGEKKQLPQTLNVLTILSMIGSVFQLISSLASYFTIAATQKMYENMDTSKVAEQSGPFGGLVSAANETVKKQYEYRTVIMAFGVVAAIACFYGAWQMRKLKKSGYPVYVAGELSFPIFNLIIIGMTGMGLLGLVGLVVPVAFVISYTLNRRYLVY